MDKIIKTKKDHSIFRKKKWQPQIQHYQSQYRVSNWITARERNWANKEERERMLSSSSCSSRLAAVSSATNLIFNSKQSLIKNLNFKFVSSKPFLYTSFKPTIRWNNHMFSRMENSGSRFVTRASSAQPLKNPDELIDSVETFIFDCDGIVFSKVIFFIYFFGFFLLCVYKLSWKIIIFFGIILFDILQELSGKGINWLKVFQKLLTCLDQRFVLFLFRSLSGLSKWQELLIQTYKILGIF